MSLQSQLSQNNYHQAYLNHLANAQHAAAYQMRVLENIGQPVPRTYKNDIYDMEKDLKKYLGLDKSDK
jgi:hypothetical protein